MKVMCISEIWHEDGEDAKGLPRPKYGEICSVVDLFEDKGSWFYSLVEYEDWFEVTAFVPLSSISETEMERDYNKVTQ